MNPGAVVTVLLGGGFIAAGIYLYASGSRFLSTAQETKGVVREIVPTSRARRHPVVEFTTAAGQEVVFTSPQHHDAAVGQALPVSYDPRHPTDARIGSLGQVRRWQLGGAMVSVLVGAALCLMAFGIESGVLKWRPAIQR